MESAAEEAPAEGATVTPDKMLRDPDIEKPAVDTVPPHKMLRTSTNYDGDERVTAGCDLRERMEA